MKAHIWWKIKRDKVFWQRRLNLFTYFRPCRLQLCWQRQRKQIWQEVVLTEWAGDSGSQGLFSFLYTMTALLLHTLWCARQSLVLNGKCGNLFIQPLPNTSGSLCFLSSFVSYSLQSVLGKCTFNFMFDEPAKLNSHKRNDLVVNFSTSYLGCWCTAATNSCNWTQIYASSIKKTLTIKYKWLDFRIKLALLQHLR